MTERPEAPGSEGDDRVVAGPAEDAEAAALGNELAAGRPVPSAAARSRIRGMVAAANVRARPARLRLLVAAYAASGAALLALVGASLAGVGPLAG